MDKILTEQVLENITYESVTCYVLLLQTKEKHSSSSVQLARIKFLLPNLNTNLVSYIDHYCFY